jgi:hypothetical protein
LGVDKPPKSSPKTYEKKSDKLYDAERTKAERQVLYVCRVQGCIGLNKGV